MPGACGAEFVLFGAVTSGEVCGGWLVSSERRWPCDSRDAVCGSDTFSRFDITPVNTAKHKKIRAASATKEIDVILRVWITSRTASSGSMTVTLLLVGPCSSVLSPTGIGISISVVARRPAPARFTFQGSSAEFFAGRKRPQIDFQAIAMHNVPATAR